MKQSPRGSSIYICVLSTIPDENDPPYDPSSHMNGFDGSTTWSTATWRSRSALVDEGVNVFVNLCDGTPDDPVSGIGLVKTMERLGGLHWSVIVLDPSRQQMKAAARLQVDP
jgi:hypothetical protein